MFTTLLLASLPSLALASTPFSAAHKLFGYAEKNGPMPPASSGELLVFNHSCATAPCVVTQIHVPSIYPGRGCPWDWESGRLRVYVDGSATPTLDLTLLQLASVGAAGAQGNSHKDISPFSAGNLFGKNAQTGGVWTTIRIPFGSTLRVTLQQALECNSQSTYWLIIRGVEGLQISLGEIELPPTARLVQSVINATTFAPDAFIPLASAPSANDGMLLYTFIDATSGDPNYLEGCFHITFGDGSTQFLSSGTEDYFLSACALQQPLPPPPSPAHTHLFPHPHPTPRTNDSWRSQRTLTRAPLPRPRRATCTRARAAPRACTSCTTRAT